MLDMTRISDHPPKIIQINCVGSVNEIILSLKEVVEQLEEINKKNNELVKGSAFESTSKNVFLKVLV